GELGGDLPDGVALAAQVEYSCLLVGDLRRVRLGCRVVRHFCTDPCVQSELTVALLVPYMVRRPAPNHEEPGVAGGQQSGSEVGAFKIRFRRFVSSITSPGVLFLTTYPPLCTQTQQ